MIYSVTDLQNMGIMDANFPYPLAFSSMFNFAMLILHTLLFIALGFIIIYLVRWIYKLF